MKKLVCLLAFILTSCFCLYAQENGIRKKQNRVFSLPAGTASQDYIPGVVIVKFKQAASGKPQTSSQQSLLQNLKSCKIVSVKRKFNSDSTASGTSILKQAAPDNVGLTRIYEINFSGNDKIESVINELLKSDEVEYAEPSYIYHSNYTPNDPSYLTGFQSYLAQVRAPQAWDLVRNSSNVVIAIIDSGTDLLHPDLAANIYVNNADPVNGIDDDRDGYIDNYLGWDFVGATATTIKEDNDPNVKSDTTFHGVHVSGIASAVSDNGVGVASVAFNAKLLIVKVGADNNGSAIYRGYEGIKYAADHGANIINCSWGGSTGGFYGQDIINYALSKGCMVTAAAGNNGDDVIEYPAGYEGVMAVANVRNTDVRSPSSNFGSYVSISAPGTNIYSTVSGNRYGTLSGTSMSAPLVASAAALVKAYYPSYTMQQVREKLRATADNIDTQNPGYTGQLGKGRLNVYRAITESPPSIQNQQTTIVDTGNGTIPSGETVELYFDLKNFLSPVTNLGVTLSSASSLVTITTSQVTVPTIVTLETKLRVGPFRVFVKPTTADNSTVSFRLDYSANGNTYRDFEVFALVVSRDYQNIEVNQVSTTLTSNGRVGYSSPNTTNGLGFLYKNNSLLFEASLMIGNSATQVSNNARTNSGSDEHFVKKVRAIQVTPSDAAFEGRSEFDDSGNPNRLNLYVKHRKLAYDAAPDDKYTVAEYEVFNQGTTALSGIYIGLYTDWDINNGDNNITKYDPTTKTGYTYNKTGQYPYAGVKLLSNSGLPVYYPLSGNASGDPLQNGDFSTAEKYRTLSSGIRSLGLGEESGNFDVSFVSGYGPYSIPAGGSVKVAFAFVAGDNLTDLQASATAAQIKYTTVIAPETIADQLVLKQNYPNPVSYANTTIEYSVPESGFVSLALYNILGQKVKTLVNEDVTLGTHYLSFNSSDIQSGIYFYKIQYNNIEKTLKMSVVK